MENAASFQSEEEASKPLVAFLMPNLSFEGSGFFASGGMQNLDVFKSSALYFDKIYATRFVGRMYIHPPMELAHSHNIGKLEFIPISTSSGKVLDVRGGLIESVSSAFSEVHQKYGDSLVMVSDVPGLMERTIDGKFAPAVQWEIHNSLPVPAEDTPIQAIYEFQEKHGDLLHQWRHRASGSLQSVLKSEFPQTRLESEIFDIQDELRRLEDIAQRSGINFREGSCRIMMDMSSDALSASGNLATMIDGSNEGLMMATLVRAGSKLVRIGRGVARVRKDIRDIYASPLAFPFAADYTGANSTKVPQRNWRKPKKLRWRL